MYFFIILRGRAKNNYISISTIQYSERSQESDASTFTNTKPTATPLTTKINKFSNNNVGYSRIKPNQTLPNQLQNLSQLVGLDSLCTCAPHIQAFPGKSHSSY